MTYFVLGIMVVFKQNLKQSLQMDFGFLPNLVKKGFAIDIFYTDGWHYLIVKKNKNTHFQLNVMIWSLIWTKVSRNIND